MKFLVFRKKYACFPISFRKMLILSHCASMTVWGTSCRSVRLCIKRNYFSPHYLVRLDYT